MKTKILIIDDSIDDYSFTKRSLLASGIQIEILYASDGIMGNGDSRQLTIVY